MMNQQEFSELLERIRQGMTTKGDADRLEKYVAEITEGTPLMRLQIATLETINDAFRANTDRGKR